MSTHKRINTVVEKEGINCLRTLVESANCIFHEIHKENDFGNDAIIEFVENETVNGVFVAVQIKSGVSYCSETACHIPADEAHFEYWKHHSLPVIGFVYDPTEKIGYWTDITSYLKNAPHPKPSHTITFDKDDMSRLDNNSFAAIFMPIFLKNPIIFDFDKSNVWARDNEFEKHLIGLTSLMYAHRDKLPTWDIFLDIFRQRPTENTDPCVIYFLALIPGHQDIFWSSINRLTDEVRNKVAQELNKFTKQDVVKLLQFIDEYGVERGTIGQNVVAILGIVEGREEILKKIALDQALDFDTREKAIGIFIEYSPVGVTRLLSELLESDDEMKQFVRQLIRSLTSSEYFDED